MVCWDLHHIASHELRTRVQQTCSWIAGKLSETLAVVGRRILRLDADVSTSGDAASGVGRLRSAKSLQDLTTILRDAQARYVPDMVDPRVWQDLRARVRFSFGVAWFRLQPPGNQNNRCRSLFGIV